MAMDIKNSRESYGKTIGIEGYDTGNVEKSIQYLMSGSVPYEFRTTVVQEFHQRTDLSLSEMDRRSRISIISSNS